MNLLRFNPWHKHEWTLMVDIDTAQLWRECRCGAQGPRVSGATYGLVADIYVPDDSDDGCTTFCLTGSMESWEKLNIDVMES